MSDNVFSVDEYVLFRRRGKGASSFCIGRVVSVSDVCSVRCVFPDPGELCELVPRSDVVWLLPKAFVESLGDLSRPIVVYFHGFGSSGLSGTVATLRRKMPDVAVVAPDIPVDPVVALPFLLDLCDCLNPVVVVGTSMGAMYAQQMRRFRRVLVNPAFFMSLLKDVLHVGSFSFFKPTYDGRRSFEITSEIVSHFRDMEERQFDDISPDERRGCIALFGTCDTLVNCRDIYMKYYARFKMFEGGHRLTDDVVRDVLLPVLRSEVLASGVL